MSSIHPDIPDPEQTDDSDTPEEPKARQTDQDTPDHLYAGKYRSVQEFEKGYWETAQEGLRQRDRALQAEQELERLRQQFQERQDNSDDEELTEAGVPTKALDARIDQRALRIMQEALAPFQRLTAAEQRMRERNQKFPGAQAIQQSLPPDLAESYNKLLATDPEAAMSMAYAYHEAKQLQQSAVDPNARRDAGTARSSKSQQTTEETGFSQEKYAELFQQAQQSGDYKRFLDYRFGNQPWYKELQGERRS